MLKVISVEGNNKVAIVDFYFTIPDGNNFAGITWAAAVTLSGKYETETIETVIYIKKRMSYQFSTRNLTNAQRQTELITFNTTLINEAQTILQGELRFTGYTIS